jgi:hypothetical protein
LIFGIYFYSVPSIYIGDYILKNPFYTDVEHLPVWLYDIDYFIFIFLVAIIIILFLIFYYNISIRIKDKDDKFYISEFVTKLFTYLYSNEEILEKDKRERIRALKSLLKNDHAKRKFMVTLSRIHNQTIGIIREKTVKIFNDVKFSYLVNAYLHSPYIRHKLFALKMISDFQLNGYSNYVLKLTSRKNNVLHSEAILTLLNLGVYKNLSFLFEIDMKLTLWDINSIVKTIQEQQTENLNYSKLINSEVVEISIIGIILARLHNRREFKTEIEKKIGYSNELLNEEAFLALDSFAENQAEFDFLIDNFELASEKAQIKIIQTLRKYNNIDKVTEFLDNIVKTKRYNLKIEAIKVLLDIDLGIISNYKKSEDEMIKQSCLQVLDINL